MHSINLLPNKGESLFTQFLSWGLSIGRLLIILTETVALGTFLYRFSLDMRIVDLHDEIKIQSFIVRNFAASEEKFRNVQERIALARLYSEQSDVTPTVFQGITDMGRGKVTFKDLAVGNDRVKIEIESPSSSKLRQFVDQLSAYPELTEISIDKVENKPANAVIAVTITALLTDIQPTQEPQASVRQIPGQGIQNTEL